MPRVKDKRVFITRDTYSSFVKVYPATVGIRMFPGCVEYGAAWCATYAHSRLSRGSEGYAASMNIDECLKRFGVVPRGGQAWYINQKGKATKENLAFSP
ncbi:MAG: hypothetical protein ACUZ9M_00815 [Candidatus Scalindua sp.]